MKPITLRRVLILVTLSGFALLPLFSMIPTARAATTYTVTTNADTGAGSLRAALTNSAAGDTINFNTGIGTIVVGSTTAMNLPAITVNLTINGNGTTIQGGAMIRGLEVDSGVVNISNLTITSGSCFGTCPHNVQGGGGLYNTGTLTLTNSTLSNNSTQFGGGGIYNGGTLTLISSTLSGNTGSNGSGGILNAAYGTLIVSNSTFSNNSAGNSSGGGIYNFGGTVTVNNSTFSGNLAQSGGGIANGTGTAFISSSTFSGNAAQNGGGIYNGGTLTVRNSTLSSNSASGRTIGNGGGLYNDFNSTATVTNSTISGNSALFSGGGIFNFGVVTVTNGIVANSTSSDCNKALTMTGINIVDDTSCGSTNVIQVNPLLATSLANNGGPTQTLALQAGSPAIAKATCTVTTDQRGQPRKTPLCDIGAFETQPVVVSSTSIPAAVIFATPLPIPLCSDSNGTTNSIVRAMNAAGTFTTFCRVLAQNGAFTESANEIGIQSILDKGVIQAVDVFAFSANGQSIVTFNSPIQICLQGSGAFWFLDASKSPRSAIQLPTTTINGYACANIPNAGTVVLTQH